MTTQCRQKCNSAGKNQINVQLSATNGSISISHHSHPQTHACPTAVPLGSKIDS
jgi:hypothetical protein